MIPILTTRQINEADKVTIETEPIASINLMERAATAFVDWYVKRFDTSKSVYIVCGTGNNGGDGLAIARLLKEKNYYVKARIVGDAQEGSDDFRTNHGRWKKLSLVENTLSALKPGTYDVVIDALFGSGLSREPEGKFAEVINQINSSMATVVSVDIASGLFADQQSDGLCVRPDFTVSFQLPKMAFFLPENEKKVGHWYLVNIGLNKDFISKEETSQYVIDKSYIESIRKERIKFGHKGLYGRGLLMAGSYGKVGACLLAGKASLRSGIGLLTAHIPKCGYTIVQTGLPEAMVSIDKNEEKITEVPELDFFNAIGIGPGIGVDKDTVESLKNILTNQDRPLVLDADALNILADHQDLLDLLPENTILTPHLREFERLVGESNDDIDRLEMQQQFSKKHNVIVVLKGAHTSISDRDGILYFNNTGNPGMATAGSGDVLTGIILAFIAQGYDPLEAAQMGVYIHGLAGDIASESKGIEGLISSDIVDRIPKAFLTLSNK